MKRFVLFVSLAVLSFSPAIKAQKAPTLEQFLSAPFPTELTAAPTKGRVAWVFNAQGARNVWVSEPSANGSYQSRQLTAYKDDDGQDLGELAWAPNAETIVYTRGGDLEFVNASNPNPQHTPEGVEQNIWAISLNGGAPRKIGDGHSPAVSPKGDAVAFLVKDQVWLTKLDGSDKGEQLIHSNGDSSSLRWSPDGSKLAFTSHRTDHGFIGVYDFATKSLIYLDPSVDTDHEPAWSPDSRRIAFIRIPVSKGHLPFNPRREGEPWSIRIADVASGKGHEIWHADAGSGSVFHEAVAENQLIWAAGDRIVFPWERGGWLHLYSVAVNGGPAKLLTPGNFEVEYVSASENGQHIVFSSNQDDIDRRHVWRVSPTADRPEAVTAGTGIETAPVVASDNHTVLVLRSDAHTTMRPALAPSNANGELRDLAPEALPADFPAGAMVTPQQVTFSGADGLQIHAQLFLPRNISDGSLTRHSNDGTGRNPNNSAPRNASYVSLNRNSNDGTGHNSNDTAPRNASYVSLSRHLNDGTARNPNNGASRNASDGALSRNLNDGTARNPNNSAPRNASYVSLSRHSNDDPGRNPNNGALRNAGYVSRHPDSNVATRHSDSNVATRHSDSNVAARHPALVFFHGGSRRQMLLGWHYMLYYSNAYGMNQYLASRGYVVLSVNYRSGIGYGLNFREALNYGAAGASEFNDVEGAGLYLRSRSDVDPARIGLWGGSYGGYLTALGLARASELFAAGVDMHGVHDWNLELPTFAASYKPGKHTDVARLAWESSPLASISTWRSPVLLIQGDDDRNVPFSQTVDLAQALRKQGVEFEQLVFPDEIHDFLLHRTWLGAYHASSDFFDKHFKMPEK